MKCAQYVEGIQSSMHLCTEQQLLTTVNFSRTAFFNFLITDYKFTTPGENVVQAISDAENQLK